MPEHLDVHLICDNYGTHKHAKVKAWLARHSRFHLHFTSQAGGVAFQADTQGGSG